VFSDQSVCLTGFTISPDYISTPGSHQPMPGGDYDAFLVKFDPAGVRIWGTYYGGVYQDGGLALGSFSNSDIFFGGFALSPDQISTPGTWQTSIAGGTDGFLARFTSGGVRLWGTYYGGEGDDAGYAGLSSGSDTIYLAGYAGSLDEIATAGSHQNLFSGGDRDGFLVKFNENPVGITCLMSNPVVIYPNPVTEKLFIKTPDEYPEITIFTLSGLAVIQTFNTHEPDVSALPSGMYVIKISGREPGRTFFGKIIKLY
jgi:hypothetical protein